MQNSHLRKLLASLLLTCILTLTALPALADSSFKAVVSEDGMEVFTVDAPHAMMGTLSKGTIVTVEAVKGKAALISSGDKQGVCPVASLRKLAGDGDTASTCGRGSSRPSSTTLSLNLFPIFIFKL